MEDAAQICFQLPPSFLLPLGISVAAALARTQHVRLQGPYA